MSEQTETRHAITLHLSCDGWTASLQDFPGCIAPGTTRDEAVGRLRAIEPNFLAAIAKRGVVIPPPREQRITISNAFWTPS